MVHFYNLALLILLSLSIFNKPISVVSQQDDDEDYDEEEALQEEIDEEDELEKRDQIPEGLYRNGPEYDAGIDEFVDLV